MCGLLTVPVLWAPLWTRKGNSLPGTASCLGLTDTALSSGDLSPNGKGEGELETFCVGFREPQLGRDGLDIACV